LERIAVRRNRSEDSLRCHPRESGLKYSAESVVYWIPAFASLSQDDGGELVGRMTFNRKPS